MKFVLSNLTSINRLPISKFAASDTVTNAYVALVGQCLPTTGHNKALKYDSSKFLLYSRMSERSRVRKLMFSPKTLKEDPDWANLGDFRQKLPEHPLPFSPVPSNPPLRSRPNFLTPIASALP